MTHNQANAVALADALIQRRIDAADLSDQQWQLLLLAAGYNRVNARPIAVAHQVRRNQAQGFGYFAGVQGLKREPAKDTGLVFAN